MALELGSMLNIGLKGVTGFPGGSDGKDSACNVGDLGSILGWEDPLEIGLSPREQLEKQAEFHSSTQDDA